MSRLARASLTAATLLLLLAAAAAAGGPAVTGPASCQEDVVALNEACYQYVKKGAPTVAPSQECCDVVRGADVPCVCRYLGSPGVSDNISMEKVFYVTQQCGVSIPGNCGGELA
ncbi:putative lipid-transfer protein DIR1 [Hordeum vulgare]|nr:putative lipid-transfer protein DIR1 [Hordeum vulgare]